MAGAVCTLGVAAAALASAAGCAPGAGGRTPAMVPAGGLPRPAIARGPAEEPAPLPDGADLAALQRYAAENNPGLDAAFARWQAAAERVPQMSALPDPRVTYGYYIDEVETRVGPQEQSIALAQTFPWFGKLHARADAASEMALAAAQHYQAERLRLDRRVADAYYEWYYLERAIGIVDGMRGLVKYLEEVATTRYRAGAAANADVIRAQVELGRLDDRLRTLEDMRGPLTARLNAALNRPASAPIPLPEHLDEQQPAADDAQVLQWLAAANPELLALDHEAAGAERAIEVARKEYYPDLTFGLTYIDTASALMPNMPDSGKDPLIAMLSLNLPIWRDKYRAGEREARARHSAALRTRQERANVLQAEGKLALYRARDAARKLDLFRDTLVPKAEQALQATETAYRGGKSSFQDLIDAQRVLLEFQLSVERALTDQGQSLAELEMLVGRKLSPAPDGGAGERPLAPEAAAVWTCPMHPQVRQAEPGACPLCGMTLVPLKDTGDEGGR